MRTTGALSLPAVLAGHPAANPLGFFTPFLNPDNDRVLVLIRLSGGNDGLNTLIGMDQLANLRQVRPNVALTAAQTLSLDATHGLHPAMGGMRDLYQNDLLGIVQSVGYPNQNRSHFRSTDIWSTASAANETLTTGWFGRYLETDHPGYPEDYPNAQFPYPLAMTMGNVVSATCQGTETNLSVVVNDPFNYLYIAPGGDTPVPDNCYGQEVRYVRGLIGQSNAYGEVVQDAANAGNTLSTTYTSGKLSQQLRNIARLISGGLGTKIYVATIGSFDTHSGQVTNGDATTGPHAELLAELATGVAAFQEDLEALGVADRVLGMTFSEFGRRIRSNQSNGTDHGDAAPLFLFGNCVQGGILGDNPAIDTQVDQNTGVPMQYDFRDVYGSVLQDWFDTPNSVVQSVVGGFTYLPLLGACQQLAVTDLELTLSPTATGIDVEFSTTHEVDNRGFILRRSEDGRNFRDIVRIAAGPQGRGNSYLHKDLGLTAGRTYYYQVVAEAYDGTLTESVVRLARLAGQGAGEWSVGLPRPNPVTPQSYVKVYTPVDDYASYEILDRSGRRVLNGNYNLIGGRDNRLPLPVQHLPTGHYVWRLLTGDGRRFARKLVKS